jgi:hypothetical protein
MNRLVCVMLFFLALGLLSCRACDCTVPEPEFGEKHIVLPEPRPPAPRPAPPAQPETGPAHDAEASAAEPPGPRKEVITSKGIMRGYTQEQLNDPAFNKKLNIRQRSTILNLEKIQRTDPRFMQTPSGVPAPPPEEEQPFAGRGKRGKKAKKGKKRKKRNK